MSVQENKRIALKFHDLSPDDVDEILTEDFIGRKWNATWNREDHREFLTRYPEMVDTIEGQIGEGDWVAIRFTRKLVLGGKKVKIEGMEFYRFQDARIAEILAYGDERQLEIEIE